MGAGYHGGFGNTEGLLINSRIFTPVYYKGSVIVNGVKRDVSRKVYQRNDINFDYVCKNTGENNLHRMLKGNAPYGRDGRPIELHHVLQKEAGPMSEIREITHKEYKRILHGLNRSGESFEITKNLIDNISILKELIGNGVQNSI